MNDSQTTMLQMTGLSKSFPGVQALDAVDFDMRAGEIHALVGENGAGKSTLIKILSGALQPDQGQIVLRGEKVVFHNPREALAAGIATINQELMLIPQLSVAENILLGRLPQGALWRVDWEPLRDHARQALAALGVNLDPDLLVESLSVAQQQVTEIARALSRQADIIVMDEPTSALTEQEIDHLLDTVEKLREQNRAVIFITHKLDEVFRVADRITVLRDGHKIGTLAAVDTSPDEVVNMMVGRSVDSLFKKEESEIGEPVLEVRNLTRKGAFYDVSLTLHRGEILGLAGLVGAGRTDLVRAIFGVDPLDSGELWVDGKRVERLTPERMIDAGLGLAPEDRKRDGLVLGMTVSDNLSLVTLRTLARWGLRNRSREQEVVTKQFSDLSIQAPSLATEVITLSGGNQQKVVIGKWLATQPRILILDEPTRGIDIGAKAEVHGIMQRLAGEGVAILLVSSELVEIMNVSDRILVMFEGRITGEFSHDEASEEKIMTRATGHYQAANAAQNGGKQAGDD
jgi:ABC-type sugar transport system ATPase subunit